MEGKTILFVIVISVVFFGSMFLGVRQMVRQQYEEEEKLKQIAKEELLYAFAMSMNADCAWELDGVVLANFTSHEIHNSYNETTINGVTGLVHDSYTITIKKSIYAMFAPSWYWINRAKQVTIIRHELGVMFDKERDTYKVLYDYSHVIDVKYYKWNPYSGWEEVGIMPWNTEW